MLIFGSPIAGAALVTGASRGIGKIVALKLAQSGMPVAVNYRQSAAEADAVVAAIVRDGGRAIALQGDVADEAEAASLVPRAQEALGPLSVVINNAGITRDRLVVQMSDADWDDIWRTDLAGPRTVARAALASMRPEGRGCIVNVGSVVGSTGNAGQANYATAKSALLGLTRELAVEAAPQGITVNSVVPGYIVTDATAHLTEEQQDRWLQRIPMKRYATPDEVADIIVFLTSASARYLTGQCIAVDGGYLASTGGYLAS